MAAKLRRKFCSNLPYLWYTSGDHPYVFWSGGSLIFVMHCVHELLIHTQNSVRNPTIGKFSERGSLKGYDQIIYSMCPLMNSWLEINAWNSQVPLKRKFSYFSPHRFWCCVDTCISPSVHATSDFQTPEDHSVIIYYLMSISPQVFKNLQKLKFGFKDLEVFEKFWKKKKCSLESSLSFFKLLHFTSKFYFWL